MSEEKKKLGFPIKGHDRCPNCGCEEGIGAETIHQLKKEGELSKEIFPKGMMVQIPLLDPMKLQKVLTPVVQMPVFTWYYDICAECKTLYVKEIDLTWQPVQVQAQVIRPGKHPGFGPPFLKG